MWLPPPRQGPAQPLPSPPVPTGASLRDCLPAEGEAACVRQLLSFCMAPPRRCPATCPCDLRVAGEWPAPFPSGLFFGKAGGEKGGRRGEVFPGRRWAWKSRALTPGGYLGGILIANRAEVSGAGPPLRRHRGRAGKPPCVVPWLRTDRRICADATPAQRMQARAGGHRPALLWPAVRAQRTLHRDCGVNAR